METKKPKKLNPGDKIAIVSLSSGMLGEAENAYEVKLGIERLKAFGFEVEFMPNALKGVKFLDQNPQARAEDLKQAFKDDSIKGIISAVGGFDTYRTFKYLLDDEEFVNLVQTKPKFFMGFSDTTNNHFMFQKLGLNTFYGPSFIVDFAEADHEMLAYTKQAVTSLFQDELKEIKSAPIWYNDRTDFSEKSLGTSRISHQEAHGFEVLRGTGTVNGKLLGGCFDSIYEMLTGYRFDDQLASIQKAGIFPDLETWKDKIVFLETSEERPDPELYTKMVRALKDFGIFNVAKAIIVGKPQNEVYYEEYKQILLGETQDSQIPILYNLNFGHAFPRTVIPYGIEAKIDFDQKRLFIVESLFAN